MVIDHIFPEALGGVSEEENLWLACRRCNEFKGIQTTGIDPQTNSVVTLFNPRFQTWTDHFEWTNDGLAVIGLTSIGRATVQALNLNNAFIVRSRKRWVSVGWHPPKA